MADEKILKDEILKDEQLDNVAGGSWMESVGDVMEAYKRKIAGFGNMQNPNSNEGAAYLLQNWTDGDNVVSKLKNMFASYGIEMTYNGKPFDSNTYTYKGKSISRDEAWNIIDGK